MGRTRPATMLKMELTKLGLILQVYSASPLKTMELESTILKRVDLNLVLRELNETNQFDSVTSNKDKAKFQPTWTMIFHSSRSCPVVSEVASEVK